ncbi:hypothetical protein DFS33DRAFT_1261128 [Desarmillaria ectypa]|nr:hypothetical protein DFS33DRAFT_1261128 [Desarmillaria ectypa]
MRHIGHRIGGPTTAEAMIRGRGVSLILKSIDARYRRPVTYPDTEILTLSAFHLEASAFPPRQRAMVTHVKEVSVWCDRDVLKKCVPEDRYI